ncbi:IcmT/TraK family protein [Gammaproteobacteria bacterium]|nr:IcmT/TraK family protein [Gammaproteobacteria bacterium]
MKSKYVGLFVADGIGSWRDSGREAKLWIFNSTASIPILFFLINISWTTLTVVILTIAVLSILDYYGFKPAVFVRVVRSSLAGKVKYSRPWWL